MEIKRTTAHISYRIEPKPDGGFVALSNDPGVEPVEGSTKEEVMHKIQAKVSAAIEQALPDALFKTGGSVEKLALGLNVPKVNVNIRRNVIVTRQGTISEQPPPVLTQGGDFQSPVIRSSSDTVGTILRIIAGLLAAGVLLYGLFLRH
jgi:hypothetical protein